MSMTVDEFIKRKVPAEHQAIVKIVRRSMREAAPKAKEIFAYGLPMWKAKHILAWISPNKQGITFGFTRGQQFEDKFDRLRGAGTSARHLKLRRVEDADEKALAYYIKQAVRLDAE
jgi:hypothetical protein